MKVLKEKQIALIYAGTNGFVDDLEVEDLAEFEVGLYKFLDSSQGSLMKELREQKKLSDELRAQLEAAIKEFKSDFVERRQAQAAEVAAT